jgi:hypothetical protein
LARDRILTTLALSLTSRSLRLAGRLSALVRSLAPATFTPILSSPTGTAISTTDKHQGLLCQLLPSPPTPRRRGWFGAIYSCLVLACFFSVDCGYSNITAIWRRVVDFLPPLRSLVFHPFEGYGVGIEAQPITRVTSLYQPLVSRDTRCNLHSRLL